MADLPARVRIVGQHFSLERYDMPPVAATLAEGYSRGYIDHRTSEIVVSSMLGPEQERQTVLHEIIHGLGDTLHIGLDEQAVQGLAAGLLALIRDNPALIAYITETPQKEKGTHE